MALFPGEEAAPDIGDDIVLGRFRFRVVYRIAGDDQGVAIHIFGPRLGVEEEVLRFDCFHHQPHYHLGWSYRDERFIEIDHPDPFSWAIEQIQSKFEGLLAAAEADPMTVDELAGLPDAVRATRQLGETHERDA